MSEAIPAETDAQSLISDPDTPIIELKNVEVTFKARTGSLFRPNHVHAVQGAVSYTHLTLPTICSV